MKAGGVSRNCEWQRNVLHVLMRKPKGNIEKEEDKEDDGGGAILIRSYLYFTDRELLELPWILSQNHWQVGVDLKPSKDVDVFGRFAVSALEAGRVQLRKLLCIARDQSIEKKTREKQSNTMFIYI